MEIYCQRDGKQALDESLLGQRPDSMPPLEKHARLCPLVEEQQIDSLWDRVGVCSPLEKQLMALVWDLIALQLKLKLGSIRIEGSRKAGQISKLGSIWTEG